VNKKTIYIAVFNGEESIHTNEKKALQFLWDFLQGSGAVAYLFVVKSNNRFLKYTLHSDGRDDTPRK